MPVDIHGKSYLTVAERVNEAHKEGDLLEVITEVLFLEPQVMVKATIKTKKGTFSGISAADPKKSIEARTPVEVAETSAVGRALAFAGYAGSEIASAEELQKAIDPIMQATSGSGTSGMQSKCVCGKMCVEKSGTSKAGKPYKMLICPEANQSNKESHSKPVWL